VYFLGGFVLGTVVVGWAMWKWHDNGWLPSRWYEDELAKARNELADATASLDRLYEKNLPRKCS
jgi:hypothetical protein